MLLGNYSNLNSNPGKNIGGFTNPYEWMKVSTAMSFYVGDHVVSNVTNRSNLYTGTRPHYSLVLALKTGELSTTGSIFGTSTITLANLAGGINISATLAGIGNIDIATGSLLAFATSALSGIGGLTANITGKIEMAATLNGQGDIVGALGALSGAVCDIIGTSSVTADITGKLEAAANLSGVGDLTAAILALVQIQSALSGVGTLNGDILGAGVIETNLTGSGTLISSVSAPAHLESSLPGLGTLIMTSGATPGDMYASITLATALSPENLAAAVWNAVAASFNSAGTMGEKMNDAGSASNPWTEVIEGSYTAAELLRLLASVLAGKSTIVDNMDGSKTITFRDINDTVNRVETDVDNSERIQTTLNLV